MTTPETVLLTQIPIALGIFWLAWELRRLRKSFDSHLHEMDDGESEGDPRPGDEAGR
jgi:hypothetical protein